MKKLTYKGFSIVELIIVMLMIVIFATISFVSYKGYIRDSRDGSRLVSINNIKNGLEIYKTANLKYPLPDNITSSGVIDNQTILYKGEIGDNIKSLIKIESTAKDPISLANYSYGVTSDNKIYQIGASLENKDTSYNFLLNKTYADYSFAKVLGNYKGYLKFNSGSEVWITNIPSLLYSNTGSVNLLGANIYYIVNNQKNLPYNLNGKVDSSIQITKSSDIIKDITKSNNATLTGVNITGLNSSNIGNYFTGTLLDSFNFNGKTDKTEILNVIKSNVLIQNSQVSQTNQTTVSSTISCSTSSYNGYSIPALNSSETKTISKNIGFGTGSINVTCSNGVLSYGSENINCLTNYIFQTGSCISNSCPGSQPLNSQINGTQSYTGSWSYNTTPGICTYICQSGYYYSGGNCLSFVNGSCSGIPSNAVYYNLTTSYTLSGALNGTSLVASYNAAPTINTCQFKCNSGYTWNGSSCNANNPNFDYTGGNQTFTAPSSGTYKLEVWGAQGSNDIGGTAGGSGGYTYGEIYLNANDTLTLVVGQGGVTGSGSGGGGSGIYKGSTLLLVSGGGGASGGYGDTYAYGGYGGGGGASGGNGNKVWGWSGPGSGGSSSSTVSNGSYGRCDNGESCTEKNQTFGAGYGGGLCSGSGGGGGAGGGSGAGHCGGGGGGGSYINTSQLSNYGGTNGARLGNGTIKITKL